MAKKGKLLKIYMNEALTYDEGGKKRFFAENLYHAVIKKLKSAHISGATVVRGIEGYGGEGFRSASSVDLSFDLPVIIEVVDEAEKIDAILPEIRAMVNKGVIMTTDVEIH
jgi:PII-like signaling protein